MTPTKESPLHPSEDLDPIKEEKRVKSAKRIVESARDRRKNRVRSRRKAGRNP